ncbi:MAG TPA: hypothetical protein VMT80_00805 [Candidatus Paceibacterota bacterium]|nr:hypothetical protein [Candidatus Paceibacterota bacterium]
MPHMQTVVLYHGKCPDGFGAAYAAWKKFGDTAEYIPVRYGDPIPEHMAGRQVILVDFCYPKEEMEQMRAQAASVTVLDHHEGVREVAESFPGNFDSKRSGATIAWAYFHPDEPMPSLLAHLEDGDLYRYALPDTRDIYSYIEVYPREFEEWDALAKALDSADTREKVLAKARIYTEYFEFLGERAAAGAKLVSFEGFECYFAVSHPSTTMKSYVANLLYTKHPPIALVVSAHPDGFGVSIRSDGSVDVAKIAQKYGGNGHPGSSGFFIPASGPLPWQKVEEN